MHSGVCLSHCRLRVRQLSEARSRGWRFLLMGLIQCPWVVGLGVWLQDTPTSAVSRIVVARSALTSGRIVVVIASSMAARQKRAPRSRPSALSLALNSQDIY